MKLNPMNSKIRVLFLASWYPNEENPISGIFIKRYAQAISKYSEVAVLYVHQSQHKKDTKVVYSFEDGIQTIRVYSRIIPFHNRLMRIFYRLLDFLINSHKGLKIIKKEFRRPDILHVNVALPMGLVALILNIWFKIPIIITEYYTVVSQRKGKLVSVYNRGVVQYLFLKFLFKRAKKIIPISQEFKSRLIKSGFAGNYEVIPCVVDTDKFKPNNNEIMKMPKDLKTILHISLLGEEKRKNVSGILKAIAILSQRRQDFMLYIVGDGPDRNTLEGLAEKLNIKNRFVIFLGRLTDTELVKIMNSSDFFVLNSFQENFSLVVAEAISVGKPIITTRCGGPDDYVNDDIGISIEPGNTEDLVKAIDRMLDSYYEYNPQKLHNYIKQRFSPEVIGKYVYDIYKIVLKE